MPPHRPQPATISMTNCFFQFNQATGVGGVAIQFDVVAAKAVKLDLKGSTFVGERAAVLRGAKRGPALSTCASPWKVGAA
jgi:hypothetical protein